MSTDLYNKYGYLVEFYPPNTDICYDGEDLKFIRKPMELHKIEAICPRSEEKLKKLRSIGAIVEKEYFPDFTFNGEKYLINSVVKLSADAMKFFGTDKSRAQLISHRITDRDIEQWGYYIKDIKGEKYGAYCATPPEALIEEVTDPATHVREEPKVTYCRDRDSNVLVMGWIYYVLALIGALIFKDFLGVWVAITIGFGIWRSQHDVSKVVKSVEHDFKVH